ncbi:MAG: hypothetical protein ACLUPD_10720 [Anaerotignum faecicola]
MLKRLCGAERWKSRGICRRRRRLHNAMKRRYALPLPEQEERQQSALVAALMGDGKVDEVMACMKKK